MVEAPRWDRAEQAAIRFGQGWAVDLAAQDGQLVAQHDDLEVFVRAA